MSVSESPDTPTFEQLPLTPTYSPILDSSLQPDIHESLNIEIEHLGEILSQTKALILHWTPMQVSNFLNSIWNLPPFMAKDIQHFCIDTKLSGQRLLGLTDEGIVNLGFNNLWTSQLMLSLELIFKYYPEKLPLNKLCKTLQPKYQLSLKKSQRAKLSSLKKLHNDLPTPIQEIFGEVKNEFPWSNEESELEVLDEAEEDSYFDPEKGGLKPFEELEYSLERHFKLTQILKPLQSTFPFKSNRDKEENWKNIMDQVIVDYWWVWLGVGTLISYKLIKSNYP